MSDSPRLIAQMKGKHKYDGNPCVRCGTTEKFVDNCVCVECNRNKARERARRKREVQIGAASDGYSND